MDSAETLDSLKRSLELAKEQLKTFDSDIKRITGRDLTQERFNLFLKLQFIDCLSEQWSSQLLSRVFFINEF